MTHPAFDEFVQTIAALRDPETGCPWDKVQTHQSIASNMIEEAYEAVDTIEANDVPHLREELGDVLLQVVLQCQIAADEGEFTIDDVCKEVNDKIVRRHPHVFGAMAEENVGDAAQVLDLWDQIKLQEKAGADNEADDAGEARESLLDAVPKSFPSLLQAQKISRKAVSAGFEWETVDDVWDQVEEEIAELKESFSVAPKNSKGKVDADADPAAAAAVELEMGDVLFSLVNVARKMGIDAETSLRQTCSKFRNRWSFMEGVAWGQGKNLEELSMEELEELWSMAKDREH